MKQCIECGSTENVDEHHTSYEPEVTVMLCRSCHWKVHNDETHRLNPDDSAPKTTIEIPKSVRDSLKEERLPHESNYEQTLRRLLDDGSGGQLWTEQEIRDLVQREIEQVSRR